MRAFSFSVVPPRLVGCHPSCHPTRQESTNQLLALLDTSRRAQNPVALPDMLGCASPLPAEAVQANTVDPAPTARVLKRRAAAKAKRKTRSNEEHAEAERDRRIRRRKEKAGGMPPITLPDYAAVHFALQSPMHPPVHPPEQPALQPPAWPAQLSFSDKVSMLRQLFGNGDVQLENAVTKWRSFMALGESAAPLPQQVDQVFVAATHPLPAPAPQPGRRLQAQLAQ